jgi:hypothetical protein
MTEEYENRRIKPIVNASYPGTLATLSLAVLQIIGKEVHPILRLILSLNAVLFVLCAFLIFFYTIYPDKRTLWTISALSFIAGLTCSLLAVIGLIVT